MRLREEAASAGAPVTIARRQVTKRRHQGAAQVLRQYVAQQAKRVSPLPSAVWLLPARHDAVQESPPLQPLMHAMSVSQSASP